MEYSAYGDKESLRDFQVIKKKLIKIIGQPLNHNNQSDDQLIWIAPFVKIKLKIEDFRGLELHLIIKNNNDNYTP